MALVVRVNKIQEFFMWVRGSRAAWRGFERFRIEPISATSTVRTVLAKFTFSKGRSRFPIGRFVGPA